MSATSGRTAVFTQQSQDCEAFVEGAWRPGSLLGWRHDGQGTCRMWVRVAVAGAEREIWTTLAEVRLPEARPGPVRNGGADPFAHPGEELLPGASAAPLLSLSEAAAREQRMAGLLAGATPAVDRRRRRHGADTTAEQPAVHAGGSAGRQCAGRHRAADAAPEEAPASSVENATVLLPRATDGDCLTRPLRVGDRPTRPRLGRPGEALRA